MPSAKIAPSLWFDTEAEEAAEYYCSIFKDAKITKKTNYPEGTDRAGTVLTVEWELDGQRFVGLNGGPQFKFNEAVSLEITCADQDEVDYYWEKLTDGGEEGMCGWVKDRYGLSWQIIPEGAMELFDDADPSRAARAFEAMMDMRKLDVAALRAAADTVAAE
jgi:predicted 3-demethylubiquinone-9 3-methyltransferase (glyoxalase superfamily)